MNSESGKGLGRTLIYGCLPGLLLVTCSAFAADSWRTVANFTAEERALYDPATSTPRDTTIPYIPAEPYPFEAPYTAEEMGFRQAEFVHISRWDYLMVDAFGVVTSSGYINQGASVGYIDNPGQTGLMGYITGTKPGEVYGKWAMYDVFPPESENTQQLWFPARTDIENRSKMDFFVYSPSLRRVRRQPEPRRDQRFPDNSQTFDDVLGRDPWELAWEVIGSDTLYETMRFPSTRQTIVLNIDGQGFVEKPTSSIKMMGDDCPYYRADGGLDAWVLKATTKPEWLPDYNEKYYVLWLEKNTFFPLRIEKYGKDGRLMMVEERLGDKSNPALGDFGYASFSSMYWNVDHDLIGYSFHDGHTLREWTDEEVEMIFSAEFMRREWLIEPIKSQVLIRDPAEWFLRPHLYPERFPGHRNMTLSPEIDARYRAQEAAGRVVFESGGDH